MSCPFNPFMLLERVKRVNGFEKIEIPFFYLTDIILEVCDSYEDWPEDQGFGSSDGTYAVKSVLDIVCNSYYSGKLMTDFTPCLSVVEYSEKSHHDRVQEMESC